MCALSSTKLHVPKHTQDRYITRTSELLYMFLLMKAQVSFPGSSFLDLNALGQPSSPKSVDNCVQLECNLQSVVSCTISYFLLALHTVPYTLGCLQWLTSYSRHCF